MSDGQSFVFKDVIAHFLAGGPKPKYATEDP